MGVLVVNNIFPVVSNTKQHCTAWVKVIIGCGGVGNNDVPVVSNTEQRGTAWMEVIIQFDGGGLGVGG